MASESRRIMPCAGRSTGSLRVYHLLRICWRVAASLAKQGPCVEARNVAGIYANAVVAGARFRRRGHVQLWLPTLHQPPAELQPVERWSQRGDLDGRAALDGVGSLLAPAPHAARPPR